MTADAQEIINNIGNKVWGMFTEHCNPTPHPDFDHMLDIKMPDGQSAGTCPVVVADKVSKASFLSIAVGPFGRYFNIQLLPDHHYDVPRLVLEGMLSDKKSQISVDMFPDKDIFMDMEAYLDAAE